MLGARRLCARGPPSALAASCAAAWAARRVRGRGLLAVGRCSPGGTAGGRAAAAEWRAPMMESLRAHGSRRVDPNAEIIEVHFKLPDGSRKTVSVPEGTTLLEAAHGNEVDLEGACEASLACCTCHVILPQDVFDSVEEACEKEEDMLDMAPCLTATSRLGCQARGSLGEAPGLAASAAASADCWARHP
ncbi:unnamed protein product [Prorocentrum cordatum]|uniref:2Fe-2S ferredoxin-type domain-containing protein n=1 Tax=Prorocentrum cordatum TaxID=2364126 RepID=A0ABN9SPT6_9DINO|nr:unnamed protein product [Polarella glacialis]